jgi:hypothetical protein
VFDRGWWTAVLVLAALHATDMPIYDSRINVAGWVLLAGLQASIRPEPERSSLEVSSSSV